MCITKELLAKFYGDSAFFAMRTLSITASWQLSAGLLIIFSWRSRGAHTKCWVAVTAGADLLIEAARVYQSVINHPVTTVLVFNSHDVWRDLASKVGSLVDYVFIFDKDTLMAYTPETAQPLQFKFRVDTEKRRVVYTKE
jgi:hypothetical protein